MNVLVLDDDRAFLDMLRAALVEEGHAVVTATDGNAGLDLAHRSPPDVILLDVRMPGMDGPAFARAYARRPGPHAPIVVLSGASPAAAARVENVAAVLAKPFELDRLMGVLREVSGRG
jgi:two-component system response regulator MprA